MKNTINWKTAPDAEKNACFAERVAGLKNIRRVDAIVSADDPASSASKYPGRCMVPDYLHSADAVLPSLNKGCWRGRHYGPYNVDYWVVELVDFSRSYPHTIDSGERSSFSEAAVVALIKAKGVKVL